MKITLSIIIGSLMLAILATVLVESRLPRRLSERTAVKFAGFAVLCCYVVCIGVVSALLSHCFNIREWLAILIAVPLGALFWHCLQKPLRVENGPETCRG